MTDERGYHLPTHLQQAEKVLDEAPAPVVTETRRKPTVTQRVRKKLGKVRGPNEGTGPSALHERKVIEALQQGKSYKVSYDNSISGTRMTFKGKFARIDENGTAWFIDLDKNVRKYVRPGAIVLPLKEIK